MGESRSGSVWHVVPVTRINRNESRHGGWACSVAVTEMTMASAFADAHFTWTFLDANCLNLSIAILRLELILWDRVLRAHAVGGWTSPSHGRIDAPSGHCPARCPCSRGCRSNAGKWRSSGPCLDRNSTRHRVLGGLSNDRRQANRRRTRPVPVHVAPGLGFDSSEHAAARARQWNGFVEPPRRE